MDHLILDKSALGQLKHSYKPNPEFTKSLKQQDRINKETIVPLLQQGFDPNDHGAYNEFPYFLQCEDTETFELLKEFGAITDVSRLDPTLINDVRQINFQFYDLYETFILSLRPGAFAMVTELEKLRWLKSKGFDFNIPPFMKLQTYSLKTPWTVFVSPLSYNLPEITSFLLTETNLDFNLELSLDDSKIKGKFLNWHFYAYNILVNEYKPVNDRKKDLVALLNLLGSIIDIHAKTSEGRNVYFILPFIKSAQAKEAARILMDLGINPYETQNTGLTFVDTYKGDKNMNAAVQVIESSKEKFMNREVQNSVRVNLPQQEAYVATKMAEAEVSPIQIPKNEELKAEEKAIGQVNIKQSVPMSSFKEKLTLFMSILESYDKEGITEIEANSFLKSVAQSGLTKEDIDLIMIRLNQGSRRFGLLQVKKYIVAANRYLKTLQQDSVYTDVVLETRPHQLQSLLSYDFLPLILNDKGNHTDERIVLDQLFSIDPSIMKKIVEESKKHEKIISFYCEKKGSFRVYSDGSRQPIYDVGMLFNDGIYATWHDEHFMLVDRVKSVLDVDYLVSEDGYLYHYEKYDYHVVPGIDNIDEVWVENFFSLNHLKMAYRHKITKKLVTVGYPQDDFLCDIDHPVKVFLNDKVLGVLGKDGTFRYRNKESEVSLSQVCDAYFFDSDHYVISLLDGQVYKCEDSYRLFNDSVYFRDGKHKFSGPVKVYSNGSILVLTDYQTNNIVYTEGVSSSFSEGVKNIHFKGRYDTTTLIEFESGRVVLILEGKIIYDSLLDFKQAERLDFFRDGIYGYTVRNDLVSIGGSKNSRAFFKEYAKNTKGETPQYVNAVFDFKEYFAMLTDKSQVYFKLDNEFPSAISGVLKNPTEGVRGLACTRNFIVMLKEDGTLECHSLISKYKGITKTSKFKSVVELASCNGEFYFLTEKGECWKFSLSSNTWILMSIGKTRAIRLSDEGLVANTLSVDTTDISIPIDSAASHSDTEVSNEFTVKHYIASLFTNTVNMNYFTRSYGENPSVEHSINQSRREVLSNNRWVHAGPTHMVRIDQFGNAFGIGQNDLGSCNVDSWKNLRKIYAIKNASIGLTNDNKILVACTNRKKTPWVDVPTKENVKDLAAVEDLVIMIYQTGITITYSHDKSTWETISESGIRADVQSGGIYVVESTKKQESQSKDRSIKEVIAKKESQKNDVTKAIEQTEQKRIAYLVNPNRHRISVSQNHFALIMDNGKVLAGGDNTYGQCEVDAWKDIVAVAAGNKFTAGLTKNGDVIYSGIRHSYSLAWNIQSTISYRNEIIAQQASDLAAVNDYFFIGENTYFIGGTENCYFVDGEGALRNSHIYDNIVKKFKNIVDVIFLPGKGDCYLDANGKLLDNKNKVIDQNILSVAKKEFMVKANGLQSSNGTVVYPEIPRAYAYDRFGLVYIDKDGSINMYIPEEKSFISFEINVSEIDTFGNLMRQNADMYRPYIRYADETSLVDARASYQWQTSHQLAYLKKGYIGIDEQGKLITTVAELKGFIRNIDKPVKAICSSSLDVAVLFRDGTVTSTRKEDLSKLQDITSLGISDTNIICVDRYGNVSVFGSNDYSQHKAKEWVGIVDVAAGPNYVLGLTEDGQGYSEGNAPGNGFAKNDRGEGFMSVFGFKNACLTLGQNSYLSIFGTVLKANDRMNLQSVANVISVSAYENTIVLVNASGNVFSNLYDDYRPIELPDLATSVLLLDDRVVAKLIDGKIKEYDYDQIN